MYSNCSIKHYDWMMKVMWWVLTGVHYLTKERSYSTLLFVDEIGSRLDSIASQDRKLFICLPKKKERERTKERKKVKTKMCFKNIFESFPSKCASEKRGDSEQMFDLCKNDIYE